MPKPGRYTITGLAALQRKLARLNAQTIGDIAKDTFEEAARPMVSQIQSLAPVEKGRLRKAIRVYSFINDAGNASYRISIGEKEFAGETFYGPMQEHGTSKMDGKHFMKRGFDQTESQVAENSMKLIATGIETEMKR